MERNIWLSSPGRRMDSSPRWRTSSAYYDIEVFRPSLTPTTLVILQPWRALWPKLPARCPQFGVSSKESWFSEMVCTRQCRTRTGSRLLDLRFKVPGIYMSLMPRDLDFVMLSSVSGIVGNRGQPNYCAGNTYQRTSPFQSNSGPDSTDGGS